MRNLVGHPTVVDPVDPVHPGAADHGGASRLRRVTWENQGSLTSWVGWVNSLYIDLDEETDRQLVWVI